MINGPSQLPELDEFFETHQALSAQALASEFDLDYFNCDKPSKLNNYIDQFLEQDGRGKIFEFTTTSEKAVIALNEFKDEFRRTV